MNGHEILFENHEATQVSSDRLNVSWSLVVKIRSRRLRYGLIVFRSGRNSRVEVKARKRKLRKMKMPQDAVYLFS